GGETPQRVVQVVRDTLDAQAQLEALRGQGGQEAVQTAGKETDLQIRSEQADGGKSVGAHHGNSRRRSRGCSMEEDLATLPTASGTWQCCDSGPTPYLFNPCVARKPRPCQPANGRRGVALACQDRTARPSPPPKDPRPATLFTGPRAAPRGNSGLRGWP